MRLSISNIAWDVENDEEIAGLLISHQVDAIDVAPGKYFPIPEQATAQNIRVVREWWGARDIEITGMQSLLFGTQGLNLFASEEIQQRMFDHLTSVMEIASGLGARRMVFGSPKNRDKGGLEWHQALEVAVSFFTRLGNLACERGVIICLEPNPTCYGANFMTNCKETAEVVASVAHSSIKMQFDSGALNINDENPHEILATYADLIGHVHISEPNLVPVGTDSTDHKTTSAALEQYLPHHIATLEMLVSKESGQADVINTSLKCAIEHYRRGATL